MPARIQRLHVEDVYALHLAHNLQPLETRRLLQIGGDGTGLPAWGKEVLHAVDFCVLS